MDMVSKKLFTFDLKVQKSDKQMIRQVELHNFRIYKGNHSFNFYTGKETARLVVIFAPNGMGKTSFFDGIEWGFSGEVSRFAEIADKSIIDKKVLKNDEAEKNEFAYVKIYQEGDQWVKRRVSEINNKTHKDFGRGYLECSKNNDLENYLSDAGNWADLMLPHHKIVGFIAGIKPTKLYKDWGGLWDADGRKRKRFEAAYDQKKKAEKQYNGKKEGYEGAKQKYEQMESNRKFLEKLQRDIHYFQSISGNTAVGDLDFLTVTASEYVEWSNQVDIEFDVYEKQAAAVGSKCSYIEQEKKRYRKILLNICKRERKQG